MRFSQAKTKVMKIRRTQELDCHIDDRPLEEVSQFSHQCTVVSQVGRSTKEIDSRVHKATSNACQLMRFIFYQTGD